MLGCRTIRSDGQLLPGTLDMLILKTLQRGQQHGISTAD